MSARVLRILYGPTASGKSALALETGSRIVNADALQIYNVLPILTAQPDAGERAQAPHALYGFADPLVSMNAAQWATLASEEIAQHDDAVLVGGTGMYITTLLDGIAPIPDIAAETRRKVSADYDAAGPAAFHEDLHKIDPVSAAKIHPNRREQMIRAMEIYEGTGLTMAHWHALPRTTFLPEGTRVRLVVFLPEKEWVLQRAAFRLDQMIAQGVLDEVRAFGARYATTVRATKAIGFHALWAHVNGALSLEDAKASVYRDTAAYIKRQLTWGRNQLAGRNTAILCAKPEEARIALSGNIP